MAEKKILEICQELRSKWTQIHNVAIWHRLGTVKPKEASVVIAITSEHRKDSLEAVQVKNSNFNSRCYSKLNCSAIEKQCTIWFSRPIASSPNHFLQYIHPEKSFCGLVSTTQPLTCGVNIYLHRSLLTFLFRLVLILSQFRAGFMALICWQKAVTEGPYFTSPCQTFTVCHRFSESDRSDLEEGGVRRRYRVEGERGVRLEGAGEAKG